MSSTTPKTEFATGITAYKDGKYKGIWNANTVNIGIDINGPKNIEVNKNIYEYGGGSNVRCKICIKNGIATIKSESHSYNYNN